MTTNQVPVTWITDGRRDKRLHTLADELHEQETEIEEGRYFWAIHPEGTIVLCHDTESNNVVEWTVIDDEDKWIVDWLCEAMTAIRKAMN